MLWRCLAAVRASLCVHEQGNNETVKTQDFGENEDKNHSDEESGLLCGSADTSIADDSDGETSSHTRETDGETGAELDEVGEEGRVLLQAVGDEDRHDEAVDTDDTRHDDGDDVCTESVFPDQREGGDALLTIRSGRRTPIALTPTPALAVP
jgi:hypothetical protein